MTTETLGPTLSASIVGSSAGPLTQTIDARWLMAYNAALSDALPRPIAHPLFAVCYEWPVSAALREQAIGAAIAALSVHVSHDLVVHRPPRAGDRLTTTGTVEDVVQRRAGALVTMKFVTVDAAGQPITTTTYGSLYRGVTVTGEPDRPDSRALVRPAADDTAMLSVAAWTESVAVAANAAHVYTECARIWNPIHTDEGVARAAGLPGIILHGTATLALCIARIMSRDLGDDPARVHGVGARFTGMVKLPSTFVLRVARPTERRIAFDALDGDGRPILSQGALST
jgi:acyl dehydratase